MPALQLLLQFILASSFLFINSTALTNNTKYDYIILGGGTCGLVVASRLSEDLNIKVAVIEAGESVRFNSNVTNTTQFGLSLGTSIDWAYSSLPQEYANNKSVVYSSGKALGGTSTINGMTYSRPEDVQIDAWEALGNPGWNWASLYPYYKKSEAFQIPTAQQEADGATYDAVAHGFQGPLDVSFNPAIVSGNIHSVINETWKHLGIPWRREVNAGKLRGFTVWPQTLDAKADVREDAARAYYYDIASRPNLDVFLNTTASRIIWALGSKSAKQIAIGVEILSSKGVTETLSVSKEVILSAGSLRTPVLLERSGIGNPEILNKSSIETIVDLKSVGENLQDQLNVFIAGSTNQSFSGYPPFATYVTAKDLFGTNTASLYQEILSQLPAYAKSIEQASQGALNALIQERLLRTQVDLMFKKSVPAAELLTVVNSSPSGNVIGSAFWGLLPFARGSVHMSSDNISTPPAINPNFFMLDWDRTLQIATARMARKLLGTRPIADLISAEITPGSKLAGNASDEQWLAWLKENYSTNYHPVGTAAMMAKELGGVVNHELIVYGTRNVRVVDASVLPFQVCGHLTSTLYAVAEKASDLIKQQHQCEEQKAL